MSAITLEAQGKQAYKSGDFRSALDYFTRALARQQTVKLYDYRAATHVKLACPEKALQDAKKAIRQGAEDPTGYLRAGKVLVRMQKAQVAMEISALGLGKVRHVGQGYEQLKTLHDELCAQLVPKSSAVDPLTLLPRELALTVLEYLTFRQRIAICRVSKGWRAFIRSESNLWHHLDLSHARSKVGSKFISTAINTARDKITAATLTKLFDVNATLAALSRNCPLERLDLADMGQLEQNLIDAVVKLKTLKELRILEGSFVMEDTLRSVAEACKDRLQVLHCSNTQKICFRYRWSDFRLTQLKALDISARQILHVKWGLMRMLKGSPLLQSLKLRDSHSSRYEDLGFDTIDLRECTHLEHVDLYLHVRCIEGLQLPPSIRTLRVDGYFTKADPSRRGDLGSALMDLPHLEGLHNHLAGTSLHHTFSQLDQVPRSPAYHPTSALEPPGSPPSPHPYPLSQLRSLSLKQPDVRDFGISVIHFERLQHLERLTLCDSRDIDDDILSFIVPHLPRLRCLDVSGTRITGIGVKFMVLAHGGGPRAGRLRHLVLNDCHDLSRDAVDWARAQGVQVECRVVEGPAGRKVRDRLFDMI